MTSRASIVITVGPASADPQVFAGLVARGADAARFNLSWAKEDGFHEQAAMVRQAARKVVLIADLPGPRVQQSTGHTFDAAETIPTARDIELIKQCVELAVDYIAVSFVTDAGDMERVRALAGPIRLIAKIERAEALEHLEEIAAASDALMVARGDLGQAIPQEEVPFAQTRIIAAARAAGKPVIVATDMLRSMVEHQEPTRAEVNDVSTAIMEGADAVMLSDETAVGRYPAEAVALMERVVVEAEKHRPAELSIRSL